MDRFHKIWHSAKLLTTLLCAWAATAGVAWARRAEEAQAAEPSAKSWIMAYALVILGVVLGLVVLCRPGRRKKGLSQSE